MEAGLEELRAHALKVLAETAPKDRRTKPVYAPSLHDFLKLTDMETVKLSADGYDFTVYVHTPKNKLDACPVHVNVHGGGVLLPPCRER